MTEHVPRDEPGEVVEFSDAEERLDQRHCEQLARFFERRTTHIHDSGGFKRFAQEEQRLIFSMKGKSDEQLYAIINRSSPKQWEGDPQRYLAVLQELRRRRLTEY